MLLWKSNIASSAVNLTAGFFVLIIVEAWFNSFL